MSSPVAILAIFSLTLLKVALETVNLEGTRCQVCWCLTWDALSSLQPSESLLHGSD